VWRKSSNKLLGREPDLSKRAVMVIANTAGKPGIRKTEDVGVHSWRVGGRDLYVLALFPDFRLVRV
jgi:hypothetical protein